jgi:phosphotriesterase-related protein
MTMIRTVMGDIDPSEIGVTLIHEHLFFDIGDDSVNDNSFNDFDNLYQELRIFKDQGGSCVVDQTTIDLGRQPKFLKQMAEELNIHIIASTGFYHENWYPKYLREIDVDGIVKILVKEIQDKIEGTEFRAGLIGEIGSSEIRTTSLEKKVLLAAAIAHMETGVPVSTHTMAGSEALFQIGIFQKEGGNLSKLIISHLDLDHVEHLLMVADHGVFLGIDTIGKPRYEDKYRLTGDEIRLEVISELVKAGHEDQIVVSHDISRKKYLKKFGGRGYGHLLGTFIPELRNRFGEEIITKFLVHNPRRALAF